MALNIKDAKTHELARELAARRGTTLTQAVNEALQEALMSSGQASQPKLERLREISQRAAALPVFDSRIPEQILGYDDSGLPS